MLQFLFRFLGLIYLTIECLFIYSIVCIVVIHEKPTQNIISKFISKIKKLFDLE